MLIGYLSDKIFYIIAKNYNYFGQYKLFSIASMIDGGLYFNLNYYKQVNKTFSFFLPSV